MDADEFFALAACFIIAIAGGIRGLIAITGVSWMRASVLQRLSLIFVPIACLALVQMVLVHWAAREVREGPEYQMLFVLGAGAWLVISCRAMVLLGISIRDDVLQRRNPAALIAALGAMVGVTLQYAGANIGEGATIWTPAAQSPGRLRRDIAGSLGGIGINVTTLF